MHKNALAGLTNALLVHLHSVAHIPVQGYHVVTLLSFWRTASQLPDVTGQVTRQLRGKYTFVPASQENIKITSFKASISLHLIEQQLPCPGNTTVFHSKLLPQKCPIDRQTHVSDLLIDISRAKNLSSILWTSA